MTHETFKTQKAVVIGGGISGLATAALLAKQGWDVTLLEKNKTLGGRARVLKMKGFTFDMGPSWYMLPKVFDRFFAEFKKKTSDFYELIPLNPRYKVFFENKDSAVFEHDKTQNDLMFEKIEKNSSGGVNSFFHKIHQFYDVATSSLIYKNVWSYRELLNVKNIRVLLKLGLLLPFWQSWSTYIKTYVHSVELQQVLSFTSLFLGGSPSQTPSIFSILTYADFKEGIFYPKKGMFSIIEALRSLCVRYGVTIKTGEEAQHIVVKKSTVAGVRTKHRMYPAEKVVGATDVPWLEMHLLDTEHQTYPSSYWNKKSLGITALMMYLGINKKHSHLTHHNLYFSHDWNKNFADIFDKKTLPKNPSLYMSVRSVTDSALTPKGCEEIVILVPLGARTTYSSRSLAKYANTIISKVESLLKIPIHKNLLVKKIYTPHDFAEDYNAFQGTALGLAHTFDQSLWFRIRHKSKKVNGLFYAGQYTNPGVGVPTALVSAQIVAKQIGYASKIQKSIFKKGSTTYYYSSLFFKDQVKHDVFALYAYVRVIDDYVDQIQPDKAAFYTYWRETKKAWNGKKTNLYVVEQFVIVAQRHGFQWGWIESFWKAMRDDLTKHTYDTFTELENYMHGSAEVIGWMMAKILDLPEEAMKAAALQGKAMQLLNFIRDVKEDDELGRRYLKYDKYQDNISEEWTKCAVHYLDIYDAIQSEAEKGYAYIPKRYLIPIKTASEMYKKTGAIIRKNPMIVWKMKVKPKKWEVLFEVCKNFVS